VSTLNSSIVSYRNHVVCRVKVVKAQEGLQRYVVTSTTNRWEFTDAIIGSMLVGLLS